MSQEANRAFSAFFAFGVLAFLIFNYDNAINFAKGVVTTGVSLSQGIAGVKPS